MAGIKEILSVYVVDDDDAVRDSLAALLEPEGFVVNLFSSVEAFLTELDESLTRAAGRACLLLDLHMPGQGGQELLDLLAGREHRLPIVVMTGNVDEQTRSYALGRGVAAFLEKPVDADNLIGALHAAIGFN